MSHGGECLGIAVAHRSAHRQDPVGLLRLVNARAHFARLDGVKGAHVVLSMFHDVVVNEFGLFAVIACSIGANVCDRAHRGLIGLRAAPFRFHLPIDVTGCHSRGGTLLHGLPPVDKNVGVLATGLEQRVANLLDVHLLHPIRHVDGLLVRDHGGLKVVD